MEEDRTKVLGTITSVQYGETDREIFTCSIGIDFGYHQSFGNIFLDAKVKGPAFRDELCRIFEVSKDTWQKDLIGKQCYGLYNFPYWNDPIEGLEAPNGKRITITKFYNQFEKIDSPLVRRQESIRRELAHFERRMLELKLQLKKLDNDYVSWE